MKTLKDFLNESTALDESYMRDIVNHKEGDIVHPYNLNGRHSEPHIIDKKTATKTVLKGVNSGEKYTVSHATGKVKNSKGDEERYTYSGFSTEAEKAEHNARKQKQHEKNAAHTAILKHLEGMTNAHRDVVGKLSPEEHAELLTHLAKLKE